MVLKDNINKYTEFWGVSSLEIRKIYPATIPREKLNVLKQIILIVIIITLINKSNSYDKSNFVALCRKEVYNNEIVNKCEMGKLVIGYEDELRINREIKKQK